MGMTNKAKINEPASVARVINRLKRVTIAADQLEEQLKTAFRTNDAKVQCETKLAALRAEQAALRKQVAGVREVLDAALEQPAPPEAPAPETQSA